MDSRIDSIVSLEAGSAPARIAIDLDRCIMAGECVYNHPEMFRFDDEGLPVVTVEGIDTDARRVEADQAVEVCPSGAISVESVR